MTIKLLLVASVLAVAIFLMRSGSSGRHLALRRLASLAFAACGVVAVVAPELVTAVANAVGVGRGTDLVLYGLVVAFLFATIAQQQRLRLIEEKLTQLTRELAVRTPIGHQDRRPCDTLPGTASTAPEGPDDDC